MRIRDPKTGRFISRNSRPPERSRPSWATEENLRKIILMPGLRMMTVVKMFYRERQRTIDISRATGLSVSNIRCWLVKFRRAGSVRGYDLTPAKALDPIDCHHRHGEEKLMDSGVRQFKRAPTTGTGRRYDPEWVRDDRKVRAIILERPLRQLEMATAYWLENLTIPQVAERFGTTRMAVNMLLFRIRREAEAPRTSGYRRRVYLS